MIRVQKQEYGKECKRSTFDPLFRQYEIKHIAYPIVFKTNSLFKRKTSDLTYWTG